MGKRKRQILAGLFIFVFAAYWCGITCFPHSHVVNGVVVVHSIPFHENNHTDTDVQFETIFFLTHFFSLECSTYQFDGLVRYAILLAPRFVKLSDPVPAGLRSVLTLRAPPYRIA